MVKDIFIGAPSIREPGAESTAGRLPVGDSATASSIRPATGLAGAGASGAAQATPEPKTCRPGRPRDETVIVRVGDLDAARRAFTRLRRRDRSVFSLQTKAHLRTYGANMAKTLTKSQIAAAVAEAVGITKKQGVATIEAIVALAYKNARTPLPSRTRQDRAGEAERPHGPQSRDRRRGSKIPAKRVVKFRVAKAAKDAILEPSNQRLNLPPHPHGS